RTGPQEPKHDGISFLLIDMDQPGVTTKPITLISGQSPFCETFFDNASAPKKDLVGGFNKGWTVAKRLLEHERTMISAMGLSGRSEGGEKRSGLAEMTKKYVGKDSKNRISEPSIRSKVAQHDLNSRAFSLTMQRVGEETKVGAPSPAAAMGKYYGTEHNKLRYELMLEAMGTKGIGWSGESFSMEELAITRDWLRTKANSIEGGTSEVQLNVISKRVLGLPD
ncbi:MAG TPA: acyl-CoA dehydrogenase, partial [Gammaproteobacteria bacterium]|nr:acyl-CoA dehydrogenase [Gammaproteobacteria bacterium]